MNSAIDMNDLILVSTVLADFTVNPAFKMRRMSQEDMLNQAGIKSRMSFPSGRGYSHFIAKRHEPRLRKFFSSHIQEPLHKFQAKPKAETQPSSHIQHMQEALQTLDFQIESLSNSMAELINLVKKQDRQISLLLVSLGESA